MIFGLKRASHDTIQPATKPTFPEDEQGDDTVDASKLTINPDHLRFKRMRRSKRAELHRQRIIELIKDKPAGTPLSLSDFARVTSYNQNSAHAMLQGMIKQGIISRYELRPHKYSYSVNDAVTTKRLKQPMQLPAEVPLPEPAKSVPPPNCRDHHQRHTPYYRLGQRVLLADQQQRLARIR